MHGDAKNDTFKKENLVAAHGPSIVKGSLAYHQIATQGDDAEPFDGCWSSITAHAVLPQPLFCLDIRQAI
jgi:hypothetical protein